MRLVHRMAILLGATTLANMALLGAEARGDDPLEGNTAWREPGRCGVNCLYILAKGQCSSSNVDCPPYEKVVAATPFTERGSSLADLVKGARAIGLTVELRKVTPKEAASMPPPYIAHMDVLDVGGAGHFVVMYNTDSRPDTVRFVDGSTGQIVYGERPKVERLLTGYILHASGVAPVQGRSWFAPAVIALVVFGVVGGIWASRKWL